MLESIAIRAGSSSDISFIYATLTRGLYYAYGSYYSLIDKAAFFKRYEELVGTLLGKPGTQVQVACLTSDPDIILGYAISTGTTLHYVYVKSAWREQGIARKLCLGAEVATHTVPQMNKLRIRKGIKFNPFLL